MSSDPKNLPEIKKEQLLDDAQVKNFQLELGPSWEINEGKSLKKAFKFQNFSKALEFVNDIAKYAIEVNHHPMITLNYKVVRVELTTHKLQGLTFADVDLAEKIDTIYTADTGYLP